MISSKFTTVPVYSNFGNKNQIGELKIETSSLPTNPGFVFAIGFAMNMDGITPGAIPCSEYIGDYDLYAIAIQSDEDYISYMRQIGKI